jgi:putative serine protease PepD
VKRIGGHHDSLIGTWLRRGIRPGAGNWGPARRRSTWLVAVGVIAVLCLVGTGTAIGHMMRSQIASQARSIQDLQAQIDALKAQAQPQPNWPVIAASVEPSVFTISTGSDLGSGWVVHADVSGADLITNFHVVATAWDAGVARVEVHLGDRIITGTIAKVDVNDDLAVIHVDTSLPALKRAAVPPRLAQSVMAIGSPLGLEGTISIGVVSGFRSIEGSDYIQFSAAISPGNSGGPVVDDLGRVVAVATAKFVTPGAEALSLAIPVQTVCNVVVCGSVGA